MIRIHRIVLLSILLMSISFINFEVNHASGQLALEPVSLDIGGEINDNFANITYSLVFDNQGSDSDTLLSFDMMAPSPLYLSNVSASMGDEVYWGKVYPIQQAQQIFDDSVSANKSAVLVTYSNNIYTFEINVKAGVLLYLDAYYEGYITRVLGVYDLVLLERLNPLTVDFSIELDIVSTFSSILSSQMLGIGGSVDKSAIANGVKLSYNAENFAIPDAIHVYYVLDSLSAGGKLITSNNGTDSFFAYLFAPEIDDLSDREVREYLFIIDVSGSMSGTPLSQAKQAFKAMIDTLSGDDQFNVVSFNDKSHLMWTESDVASDSNKDSAKSWVNGLSAGGSTNINDAIVDGFATFSGSDTAKAVAFLSDGAPTAGEKRTPNILENVRMANNDDVPIFSVAFGDRTDEDLMGSLAFESNGLFTKILPGDEAIHKLELFYNIFAVPVALGVSMGYRNAIDILPLPSSLVGALFNGSEIMTTGRYSGTLEITTKIIHSNGDQTYTNSANDNSANRPHIERIWAYNSINNLVQQVIADPSNQTAKDAIVNIAVDYGIVVPGYTGLTIVVENKIDQPDGEEKSNRDDLSQTDSPQSGSFDQAQPDAQYTKDNTRAYATQVDADDDAAPIPFIFIIISISLIGLLFRYHTRRKY